MTDEGVGGEEEDEEGDEQVHGEQGERRRGLLRVEDALEAEEAEGLLGAGIRLKVRGRGETHSEQHRGVQLGQRRQGARKTVRWLREASVSSRKTSVTVASEASTETARRASSATRTRLLSMR